METKTVDIAAAPKSFDATSFFEHPASFSQHLKRGGVKIPFTVTRISFGVEGCQCHNVLLSMDTFAVAVSFGVLARDYGQKHTYNQDQLRILDDIYEDEDFLKRVTSKAGAFHALAEDQVSLFFTFERNGLSKVNVYLSAKVGDINMASICHANPIRRQDALSVMLVMLSHSLAELE
jgi:hypothetical protein